MYRYYRERVAFVLVYIREAHPDDGWQMQGNIRDRVVFNAPTNLDERTHVATSCREGLDLSMPMVLDGMDNAVEQAYAGWPDRLYLMDIDGTVAYKGGPGPGGFNPMELSAAIDQVLARNDAPPHLAVVPADFEGKPTASVQIQFPWDVGGVSNLMLPENLFSGDETLFTGQNWVEVDAKYPQEEQPEMKEVVPARLVRYRHPLGEEYVLSGQAEVRDGGIDVELTVENLTDEPLEGLRAQVCFGCQQAADFASEDLARVHVPVKGKMRPVTEVKRVGSWDGLKRYLPVKGAGPTGGLTAAAIPFIGLENSDGTRSVGITWQGATQLSTNGELTCIHADPTFPDCPPGESVTAKGRIFFTKGDAQTLLQDNREAIEEVWTD